jgi:tetratricopeptide (TPR) repeat protein
MTHLQADGGCGNVSVRVWASLLTLLGLVAIAGGGCASQNPPQVLMGEYKKILERQKAGMPMEDDVTKKLPEMTAPELERLGDTYLRQGNLNMAFLQYDKALRMEPSQARVRYKVGLLFLKRDAADEALKEFQEILKQDARYALAYEGTGQALLKMQKYAEAEQYFRHALALDSTLWQCHNFLGIVYDRQKRFDEAITEYQAAIALKPEHGFLYNNLGVSYLYKSDYELAVQAFMQALKSESSQRKVYNNLGAALAKLGRYDEALEAFKNGGDEAKAYNNLGVVYLGEKRYQEAIASFEKAVQLSPSHYLKASENLKTARQALAEAASIPRTTSKAPMPPSQSAPRVDRGRSDSDRQSPEAQPTTIDRRSESENILQMAESGISGESREAREPYTIQVHSFRTRAKAEQVVAHYRQRGYPAFPASPEGAEREQRWRVLIGHFATEATAEAFGRDVSLKEGLADFLVVRRNGAGA